MADPRREARELVVQALYEADVAGHESRLNLARLIEDEEVSQAAAEFAKTLLEGVIKNRDRIDAIIERTAPLWPAEQLAPIDRNILRLAIREFLVDNLTPVRAAINEAVELAKTFGSESSPKFVNGVLGSVSSNESPSASQQEVE